MAYDDKAAAVYDAIYEDMKDYRAESERVKAIINEYKQSDGNDLLDVACGTGLHDQYLKLWFSVEGVDLSNAQLTVARKRLPEINFHEADMTNFDLKKQYDTVTCLFSSIGNVLTYEKMKQAIARMTLHLKPGGVLVVEPWLHPDSYISGHQGVDQVVQPDLNIIRVNRSTRKGIITRLKLDHYVSRNGEYEEPFTEYIEAAMYTIDEYTEAFRAAGLEVWHDKEGLMGRGLFIGRKPS